MNRLEQIYRNNLVLLERLGVKYTQWQHEPILDFATDEKVALELGWTGTHSKSLFLKMKGGGYVLYLTDKDTRLDSKALKLTLGKRVSIVCNEEMTQVTGCVPGAVSPFDLPNHVIIVVDSRLYQHNEILYTPGLPDLTIGIAARDLRRVLTQLDNPLIET